jgi:DNA-binding CsgD family transcriptional regulator
MFGTFQPCDNWFQRSSVTYQPWAAYFQRLFARFQQCSGAFQEPAVAFQPTGDCFQQSAGFLQPETGSFQHCAAPFQIEQGDSQGHATTKRTHPRQLRGARGTVSWVRRCCPKRAEQVYGEDSVFFEGAIFRSFFGNFDRQKPYSVSVRKKPAAKPHPGRSGTTKWDLTRRESEVLGILSKGATDKEIAHALGISRFTVSKHVEHILKKMKVTSRTAAASLSWRS